MEDEAKEFEPQSFGMNSFLYGDSDGDGGTNDDTSGARKNIVQVAERRVAKVPPYDMGSATNVRFRSEIIGMTDRLRSAFLSVPGQYRGGSSGTLACDDALQTLPGSEIGSPYDQIVTEPDIDVTYSPYDRTRESPPMTTDDIFETSPGSQMDLVYSPYDGSLIDTELPYYRSPTDSQKSICSSYDRVTTTRGQSYGTTPESETDLRYSPYGGNSQPDLSREVTRSRSFASTRRYGTADRADSAQALEDTIPAGGHDLLRTTNYRNGLCDLADFDQTCSERQSATSYKHLDRLKPGDDKSRTVQGGRDDLRNRWVDPDTFKPLYEGLVLLQKIIDELDDSDAEDGDPKDGDEVIVSCLTDEQDDKDSTRAIGGLCDFVDFGEDDSQTGSATSHRDLDWLKLMDDKPRSLSNDIGIHDGGDDFQTNWADPDTFRPLYEGLDLLQEIIDGLDDSDAEDGDSGDGEDSDEGSILRLKPTWGAINSPGQASPEWPFPMSDDGLTDPVTPSQRSPVTHLRPPRVHQGCMGPSVTPRPNEELQIVVPTYSDHPPWLPCKAYVRTRGPRRPLLMVQNSPPPMSAKVVVSPSVYMALVKSPATEEVQATCSNFPPGLQSKAYVRTHRRSRPLPTFCDSQPQIAAALQIIAPSGNTALMESQVTPCFTEEIWSGLSPGLRSEVYVRPRRSKHPPPMVCGPYLSPCLAF